MAKRQATSQINHENWDEDEEKEVAGTFRCVSEKELQNRVVRRAKRTLPATGEYSTPVSPFRTFIGFSRTSQPSFGFNLQKTNVEAPLSSKEKEVESTQNGCPNLVEPQKSIAEKVDFSLSSSSKISEQTTEKEKSSSQEQDLDYYRMLQNLNESVMKWMQLHFSKNPYCNFCPVFNDYKNYVEDLEVKYLSEKQVFPQSSSSAPSTSSSLHSVSKKADSEKLGSSQMKSGLFKRSDSSGKVSRALKGDDMHYGAAFASNTTNTSTFSFGIKNYPTATTSGSQVSPASSCKTSEKAEEETPENKRAPFSFSFKGSSSKKAALGTNESQSPEQKPFSFGFAAASQKTETVQKNEDEEYVPPKNEFNAVSEDDALYSKRCKLFYKKGSEFMDRGVGMLYLKSLDGKTQLLVRADTNLGNILLNIRLTSSLPLHRTGKNNVIIVCVPNPPLDPKNPDSKEAVPFLIRVKTSDDADELLKILQEHQS